MKLIHYCNKEFELKPLKYDQCAQLYFSKPTGLWISVEGDDDWKEWCEAENFQIENLEVSYEVILKEDANILHLKTVEEIFEFSKRFPLRTRDWDRDYDTYQLEWEKIAKKYQGIIIAPYQWKCRLALESSWYYGWDCASGCIWDIDCISEFKLI
jgi:hypothetical protein